MSYIDLGILGVFMLCILVGYNQGFLKAIFVFANFFVSLFFAFILHKSLAQSLVADGQVLSTIIHFSEASDMLKNVETVRLSIYDITPSSLEQILSYVKLSHPLDILLMENIQNQAFASIGLTTIGEYLGMTIANMAVNIVCFIAVFISLYVCIAIIINLCDYVIGFPVLKYMDSAAGAILGFLQGMLILFIIFLAVPLILAFLPFEELTALINNSSFATFYYRSNFIIDMIKGVIP